MLLKNIPYRDVTFCFCRLSCQVTRNPAGPYRAINSQKQLVSELHDGMGTLDKVFEYAVKRFPRRDCLGTREVLSEEDEVQPNGKVFKKVRQDEHADTHHFMCA